MRPGTRRLWIGFVVLSVVAFFAILFTGRYPRPVFAFNVGVLRWSWRVGYYAYGALGTDRYPPFSLEPVPDYPATLDIAYPEQLSRGLVLVKWWLLAIPHYLVLGLILGGTYAVARSGSGPEAWEFGGGLVGLLTLFAGIALLFTGRYPRGVFDLLLGMHRWALRVAACSALMTDSYPPLRLDLGGDEPDSTTPMPEPATEPATAAAPARQWTAGRVVAVVAGSVLLLGGLGAAAGATVLLAGDRAGRDAAGFLMTPNGT